MLGAEIDVNVVPLPAPVEIVVENSDAIELPRSGAAAIGFVHAGLVETRGLLAMQLTSAQRVVLSPAGHALAKRPLIDYQESRAPSDRRHRVRAALSAAVRRR